MKIKLIRYPYKDFETGEIVDLGEDKNKSMVSLQRAVWYDPGAVKKKDPVEEVIRDIVEEVRDVVTENDPTPPTASLGARKKSKSKFFENEIRKDIQEKTEESKKGFWDKLK